MDLDVFYRESIVKAELPFAVGADEVVAETPFYAQPHPVNPRTSFEKAKIELRAQKWLDMSGEDYGVTALLTATSGFDVKDGRLRLTLVKGGANPNPNTDVGSHRIEYALEPHPGDWKTADAWKRGYEYHYPIVPRLEPQHEGTFPARKSFGGTAVGTASDHVCWEALKPSEDGDDLVVRVYEAEGARGGARRVAPAVRRREGGRNRLARNRNDRRRGGGRRLDRLRDRAVRNSYD